MLRTVVFTVAFTSLVSVTQAADVVIVGRSGTGTGVTFEIGIDSDPPPRNYFVPLPSKQEKPEDWFTTGLRATLTVTTEQAETVVAGATVVAWFLRLLMLGWSVGMVWAAVYAWQVDREFASKGLSALVQPIDAYKAVTTVTKRLIVIETNRSTSFSADIAFETADKRVIKMNRSLPEAVVELFRGGQPVWIQYLPDDPTNTRFVGENTAWWVFLGIGLIASAITVLVWRTTKVARPA